MLNLRMAEPDLPGPLRRKLAGEVRLALTWPRFAPSRSFHFITTSPSVYWKSRPKPVTMARIFGRAVCHSLAPVASAGPCKREDGCLVPTFRFPCRACKRRYDKYPANIGKEFVCSCGQRLRVSQPGPVPGWLDVKAVGVMVASKWTHQGKQHVEFRLH
jgi:hypothetical protein